MNINESIDINSVFNFLWNCTWEFVGGQAWSEVENDIKMLVGRSTLKSVQNLIAMSLREEFYRKV